MAERAFFDLDLLIDRSGGLYRARVLHSPAGDGQTVMFERPFSDLELENFLLKMGRSRGRTRRIESAPVAAAKQFGGRLFSAVFTGQVGECLRRSVDRAQDEDATLRIRLRLSDCPELADLPWEFIYDRDDDWFVALSGATPVLRYVQLAAQPRPLHVTLPLRVLAIRSEPSDYPHLDVEAEWSQVMTALREFTDSGAITVTDLAAPTLSELRRVLLRERFHVLHYMGHGGFTAEDGGVLLFTDQAGRGVPVTGEQLSVMLRDHTSLRLAVLNACEAGRTDPADPFGGIADTLVRRGIPAVIAMQFEISDTAAVEFAPALYGALAAGRPVDAALAEARKAIYAVSALEWATPVLHLRADNARLFDITEPADLTVRGPRPGQPVDTPAHTVAEEEPGYPDAVRLSAENGSTGAELGRIRIREKRYPQAEAAFREAIRADPNDTWTHSNLGYVLLELNRYQEAESALREAVRIAPGNAYARGRLGYALLQMKRYQEAETALREAIELDPGDAFAHGRLGHVLGETDEYAAAEVSLREAIRLDPGDAFAHRNLGYVLLELKRYQEAETTLREAIRLDPEDAYGHGRLGYALLELKRYQEAETALREAIALDPAGAFAHGRLGYVLCEQKRYQEAETALREAIRLDPGDAFAHRSLGHVLSEQKRYQEAETALREAIRLDPGEAWTHGALGRVLIKLKRYP